ncbi:hypothetical protein [Aliikangiella maris]|uniref:Uncharacterized protein n=2 Tax=Aliikangiella maris TaxID=3162458 RepID=A0ABV2BTA3_9GAMM
MKTDHVDFVIRQWQAERPDLDSAPTGVIGRVGRLNQFIGSELQQVFSAHDLLSGEFDVLATLLRSGPPLSTDSKSVIKCINVVFRRDD